MSSAPAPRASNLADLARLAGVSVSTVSRALANHPAISERTRRRIAELARAHDFQLNATARNLRLGKTHAIAVLLPLGHERSQHLYDPFFLTLLGHLADVIANHGYDLLLSRVLPEDDRWLDAFIDSGRADGVIVVGQSDQIATLNRVGARYRNMVVWGAYAPGNTHLTIGSDNVEGGRLAGRHLIGLGRRRLLFLGNPEVPEFGARYKGFLEAVAEAPGVAHDLLPAHLTAEGSYAHARAWLTEHVAPDGICAASDILAMSTLRALSESGLSVPEDVAVVGYDDVPLASHTTPPLTTVKQDLETGAAALCDMLLARMRGEEVASVQMPPRLVVRGSSMARD